MKSSEARGPAHNRPQPSAQHHGDLWGPALLTAWPPGPPLPPRPPQTLRQTTGSSAPSEATPGSRVRVKSHQARALGWCTRAQVHLPPPRLAISLGRALGQEWATKGMEGVWDNHPSMGKKEKNDAHGLPRVLSRPPLLNSRGHTTTDCKTSSLSPGDEAALVLGSGSLSVWGSRVSSTSCLTKTRS